MELKPDDGTADSHPATKPGDVTLDDKGKPVPFTITEEQAVKEIAETIKQSGPVPLDGGAVKITTKP